jgi:hypoxanthine phosphoribosyltransferase
MHTETRQDTRKDTRQKDALELMLVDRWQQIARKFADLARAIPGHVTLDFMAHSSYGNSTRSSGQVQVLKDLGSGIEGRDVVIVEDIVDTGLTLTYLQDILRARAPRSLRTACLLSKPSRRQTDVKVDYVGFTIDDKFVVGYGLDFSEQHRNLPYIAVVDD